MKKRTRVSRFCLLAVVVALFASVASAERAAQPVADVVHGVTQVEWVATQEHAGLKLSISGPEGVSERHFGPGEPALFELASLAGPVDGFYNWELTASPVLDANVRSVMAQSRVDGAGDGARSRPAGLPPRDSLIQSGSFRVVDGAIVQPADEAGSPTTTTTGDPNVRRVTAADQVIPDDLIVQMSLCVGFDCVNNENFGFDTIRLKENNLRIHFDDTSSTGSFPNRDWRLVANDSANGGRNVFFLEDSTASREVFSVEAGAPSNALWVDSTGNIGAGTSTPVLQLHIKDGNTPGMRLEQDNSSGFTAQTWDVAGNEANFFVRDVTGGSLLSFRIRPGAPSSSIDIAAGGNVGIGTASPDAKLDVEGSGDTEFLLTRTGGTGTTFRVTATDNNAFFGTSTNDVMAFTTNGAERMRITAVGRVAIGCTNPTTDFEVQSTSDAVASCGTAPFSALTAGDTTFTASSSRALKENLRPVTTGGILDKMAGVGVYEYDFIDGPKDRLGLMAEDFHKIFERGPDTKLSGQEVQMALWLAVQELAESNRQLRQELDELKGAE